LESELAALDSVAGWTRLVADLVAREESVQALVDIYARRGFVRHATLLRMSRLSEPGGWEDYVAPEVTFAGPEDAPAILAFLERLLDPLAEQIPNLEEIQAAAARQEMIVLREQQDLAGVLYFESHRQTAILRYWWLDERFRERGMGSRLIKTFFQLCREARRIVLWVYANNATAVAK
jgi:RimJ/RimL family protein N-acetyltransferase